MVKVLSLLNREGREFLKQLSISNKKESMIDSMGTLPCHKINIYDIIDQNEKMKSFKNRGRDKGGRGKSKSSKRSRLEAKSVLNSKDDDKKNDENESEYENENDFKDFEEDSLASEIHSSDEDEEEEEEEDKGRGKKMKTVQRRKSFSSSSISKRSKYEKKFHSKTLHTFLSY